MIISGLFVRELIYLCTSTYPCFENLILQLWSFLWPAPLLVRPAFIWVAVSREDSKWSSGVSRSLPSFKCAIRMISGTASLSFSTGDEPGGGETTETESKWDHHHDPWASLTSLTSCPPQWLRKLHKSKTNDLCFFLEWMSKVWLCFVESTMLMSSFKSESGNVHLADA